MNNHLERGMATAEYTVGTLGAAVIATILYRLGLLDAANPWLEALKEAFNTVLAWGKVFEGVSQGRFR